MGHKGANKLKPKKNKTLVKENVNNSSVTHPDSNAVQSFIKNNTPGKGETPSPVVSNKKRKKGK